MAPPSFLFFFLMQKTTARSAMKKRNTEPMIMPTIAPTDIPLLDSHDWLLDDGGVRVPNPE